VEVGSGSYPANYRINGASVHPVRARCAFVLDGDAATEDQVDAGVADRPKVELTTRSGQPCAAHDRWDCSRTTGSPFPFWLGTAAKPLLHSQFPTRYMETLGALGAANAEYVQGIIGAQLRFAARFAAAVSSPRPIRGRAVRSQVPRTSAGRAS
jgi:hypothetical protein